MSGEQADYEAAEQLDPYWGGEEEEPEYDFTPDPEEESR